MGIQLDIISIEGSIYTLFAVDIGNSAIKFFSKDAYFHFSYKSNWEQEVSRLLGSIANQNVIFVISSVNPEKNIYLQNFIDSNMFFQSFEVSELLKDQNLIDLSMIRGMGNDRILGMIGGLNYFEPPFITVDLGTATTINLLGDERKVIGGAILPGIFTQFRSLIENTAALKKIRLEVPMELIGSNTNEAISSGIVNGMFATVSYFLHTIKSDYKKNIPILLTGGNSGWIKDKILTEHASAKHIPTLVLEGIIHLTKSIKQ